MSSKVRKNLHYWACATVGNPQRLTQHSQINIVTRAPASIGSTKSSLRFIVQSITILTSLSIIVFVLSFSNSEAVLPERYVSNYKEVTKHITCTLAFILHFDTAETLFHS
jgi:hypothetical protein